MTDHDAPTSHGHGQIGYLQLPSTDVAASVAFYGAVFGWRGETEYASFEAPGVFGGWLIQDFPVATGPAVLWLGVDWLWPALNAVTEHGGEVVAPPWLDQGARWLAEVTDPSGNRLELVAPQRTARAQTMIAVQDVETSSCWYQRLLGLTSDHGGPEYERLLADGELVLQLHQRSVEHHHGAVGGEAAGPAASGVLLWFGEVSTSTVWSSGARSSARRSSGRRTATRPPRTATGRATASSGCGTRTVTSWSSPVRTGRRGGTPTDSNATSAASASR